MGGLKHGFLTVLKPKGTTSHGLIEALRSITGIRKIGHCGTLDALASGVMLCGVGQTATRFMQYFVGLDKVYLARIRLGQERETGDCEGDVLQEVSAKALRQRFGDSEHLESAISQILHEKFNGNLKQRPPIYSSLKFRGRRYSNYARSGELHLLLPHIRERDIVVYSSSVKACSLENLEVSLQLHVSSGTYIRSIAHDLSKELCGVGGHLLDLVRLQVGGSYSIQCPDFSFQHERAMPVEDSSPSNRYLDYLFPTDSALDHLPAVYLNCQERLAVFAHFKQRSCPIHASQIHVGESSRRYLHEKFASRFFDTTAASGNPCLESSKRYVGKKDSQFVRVYDRVAGSFLGVGSLENSVQSESHWFPKLFPDIQPARDKEGSAAASMPDIYWLNAVTYSAAMERITTQCPQE